MPQLTAEQRDALLDTLRGSPVGKSADDRRALLFGLPQGIQEMELGGNRLTDFTHVLMTLETWGILADGRCALNVFLRNAVRACEGSTHAVQLDQLLQVNGIEQDDPAAVEEVITGEVSRLQSTEFLILGSQVRKSVARLRVPRYFNGELCMRGKEAESGLGTGWLVAPSLLLTNEHVIASRFKGEAPANEEDRKLQALATRAWFGYLDEAGRYEEFRVEELLAVNPSIDYALLKLSSAGTASPSGDRVQLSSWGYLRIGDGPSQLSMGERLNIVQHPLGEPQQVAFRRNTFVKNIATGRFLYLTDTHPGSSGSPVCDDEWLVRGMHRAGRSVTKTEAMGETIRHNNEGIDITSILNDLPAFLAHDIKHAQSQLKAALP